MNRFALAAASIVAIALTSCAPVAPLPGLPTGQCSANGLGNLINRRAIPPVLAQAKKRSGASVVRVLRPGQIVTMEFLNGRLNVQVDDRNWIKSFNCG